MLRCPKCGSRRGRCVKCGAEYAHGTAGQCQKERCKPVGYAIECLCGRLLSSDGKGVKPVRQDMFETMPFKELA